MPLYCLLDTQFSEQVFVMTKYAPAKVGEYFGYRFVSIIPICPHPNAINTTVMNMHVRWRELEARVLR